MIINLKIVRVNSDYCDYLKYTALKVPEQQNSCP